MREKNNKKTSKRMSKAKVTIKLYEREDREREREIREKITVEMMIEKINVKMMGEKNELEKKERGKKYG